VEWILANYIVVCICTMKFYDSQAGNMILSYTCTITEVFHIFIGTTNVWEALKNTVSISFKNHL
jgi:hypothetical protein